MSKSSLDEFSEIEDVDEKAYSNSSWKNPTKKALERIERLEKLSEAEKLASLISLKTTITLIKSKAILRAIKS
ncbi:MAG: hypothetical protein ABH830_03080 [Patescibacteria group bacterium]